MRAGVDDHSLSVDLQDMEVVAVIILPEFKANQLTSESLLIQPMFVSRCAPLILRTSAALRMFILILGLVLKR